MKMTGAQIIIETLLEQDADTVFGYPGGAVLNIYDELYKNSERIRHIIAAHEQGASHAADGYARVTGKPGVVIATSGPGATNLVTGIANAYLDSTPMVAITGNVATSLLGRDSFQEVDITGITMPVTKHNFIVKDVTSLADTIREAFRIAKSGRPGPVLIDVPKDVQVNECDYRPAPPVEAEACPAIDESALSEAVGLIQSAKKPFLYCGGGVVISDASEELRRFADQIDAPMGFSMMGLSAVPYDHKGYLGMTGMHGQYAASRAKAEADLIVAIGVRFSDRATGNKREFAKNAKVLHIDIDPAEINKNITAYTGLIGNIKDVLRLLCEKTGTLRHEEWKKQIEEMKREQKSLFEEDSRLSPKKVIRMVRELADRDTVIATDVGQHQMWTAQEYQFTAPRTFITSGGLGTMGFGMGAAIGACVGKNGKRTVLFTGDGSFGMNLNELATAVSNRLPLVIVIMNNGVLGMVRQWQTLFFDHRFSSTTLNRQTDFVKLAEAFGAEGYRASTVEECKDALQKAFAISSPVVIDCQIDMDEKVLPMIPPNGSIDDIILK